MQRLIYLLIFSIFLLDFLNRYGLAPRQITWLPEILSVFALFIVLYLITKGIAINLNAAYWLIFSFLAIHVLFGLILNEVHPGAIFSGARKYLKYMPFFFLPLIYLFSDTQIKKQLQLIIFFIVFQLPVVTYQRFVQGAGGDSGDVVRGTFGTSSYLSIFLISAFSVALAFYLKGKITRPMFLGLAVVILIPTMLNETKGTLFLLPLALFIPVFFVEGGKQKFKGLIGAVVLGGVFLSIFIPTYDYFFGQNRGIVEFFTEGGIAENLAPQTSGIAEEKGWAEGRMGRLDMILSPIKKIPKNPIESMFGVGMGNASTSFLGRRLAGEYAGEITTFMAFNNLMGEIGLLGTLLVIVLFIRVFFDALKVRTRNNITGALALGWAGVVAVLLLSIFYKNTINQNAISYLFWFLSGHIIATRVTMSSMKKKTFIRNKALLEKNF